MSLTSDEVNYLVFRYLQESGFSHSAFTFSSESLLNKANLHTADVAPGALISFLQKGLLYQEAKQSKKSDQKPDDESEDKMDEDDAPSARKSKPPADSASKGLKREPKLDRDIEPGSPETDAALAIPEQHVLTLKGHMSEVFICAWSPTNTLLASGSGDSTARIWNISKEALTSDRYPIVLKHFNSSAGENSKDVTTLDWHPEGNLLATGSYDGLARVWSDKGELVQTLARHKGPIFSLKWNKKGDSLLSGSVDKSAVVWDARTGEVRQQFEFHKAPTLDVDWRNNTSFATCSTDKMIFVCEVGKAKPLKQFAGHQDEVNAIKWDPSGTLLASCSDDFTAKIWSPKQDKCVHDLREHSKEIYTIKWSPTGVGSDNPNKPPVLASASFDASIKLWDVEAGTSFQTLQRHTDPVYSVAFSPNGEYLASGSFDRCLYIWSVRDGKVLRSYRNRDYGGIFEVCWNKDGDKVAACFANNTVCVFDIRM